MKKPGLSIHLTFNGNCREAMLFYKDCLGGELALQTMGESQYAGKMPALMRDAVVHAVLEKDGLLLMGSDMVGEEGLISGNAVSLLLRCGTEEEISYYYNRLSEGGVPRHPPQAGLSGAAFGDLTDKFGNQWLLQLDNDDD